MLGVKSSESFLVEFLNKFLEEFLEKPLVKFQRKISRGNSDNVPGLIPSALYKEIEYMRGMKEYLRELLWKSLKEFSKEKTAA